MEDHNNFLDLSFNTSTDADPKEFTLVGQLITHKTVNHKVIINVMEATWNLGTNVIFKPLDHNMILCTFRNVEDKNKMEAGGPWTVKEAVLNLKKMGPK